MGKVRQCKNGALLWLAATGVFACLSSPALSQAPHSVALLKDVQPGLWQFTSHDPSVPSLQLCVGDMRTMFQIRHRNTPCTQYLISDDGHTAQVHYSCQGQGYGETRVRIETPRALVIDTQGTHGHDPFADVYYAQRLSECAVASNKSHPR